MSNENTESAMTVLLSLHDKLLEKHMRSVDLFRQIDESGDGVVSPEEFRTGLESFGFSPSKNEFHELMKVLDRDGDGEVDFREFDKAIKRAVKQESASARTKRLAADLALEPAEGAVSDGFLTTLMEKAQKKSHFFRGFTKNELRSLLKVSQGTIQCTNKQTVLPPGIQASWLGLVLQGSIEARNKENPDEVLASYKPGSFLRAQAFLDGYHRTTQGRDKTKLPSGTLKLNVDKKNQKQPVRCGASVVTHPPGFETEYYVGSQADSLMLCFGYTSLDFLRESEATKDLAYKFLQKLSHAQSSEYLERMHQTVHKERATANDTSGSKEAAKVAKMNKQMEEMEIERKKIEAMMKKAKEAVHKAKNNEVLKNAMERKLKIAETKLEEVVKKTDPNQKDNGDSNKPSKKQLLELKKLKKQLKEQAVNSKRKLESLRKMLTDQFKRKTQKSDKNIQKKIDTQTKKLREKIQQNNNQEKEDMLAKIQQLKDQLDEKQVKAAAIEVEAAAIEAKEAELAIQAKEKEEELNKRKKKSKWGKIRKKHNDDVNKKKELRENFKNVMQEAHKQRLKLIRDEALTQLEVTRAMLLQEQDMSDKVKKELLRLNSKIELNNKEIEELSEKLNNETIRNNDLETKIEQLEDTIEQNTWEITQANLKEKRMDLEKIQMNIQMETQEKEMKTVLNKFKKETIKNKELETKINQLEYNAEQKVWEMKTLTTKFQDVSLINKELEISIEQLQKTLQASQNKGTALENNLAKAHGTIAMHVKYGEEKMQRISVLEKWCKKSHQHRIKLEDLIKRFEIEMNAARDAIWSQAIKNKEMQESLTQMASDQVNVSDIRSKMLYRLQISEMRRIELENRFSTLARASTPLMNEIRAIEQHGALILAEDEEFMSINHSKKKMILNDGKDLNGDEIDREERERERGDERENNNENPSENPSENGSIDSTDSIGSTDSMMHDEETSTWVSPYLKKTGRTSMPLATMQAMDLSATARMQQQTLITLEEQELLDPSQNSILFIGANSNTNVLPVMLLEQKGYVVQTISSLKELKRYAIYLFGVCLVLIFPQDFFLIFFFFFSFLLFWLFNAIQNIETRRM